MKNVYWSIVLLFAVLLSANFVSACVSPDSKFTLTIQDLQPSSGLTIEKIIGLCTKEICVIDEAQTTITIKSHYDNSVALIFSQGNKQDTIALITKIPYKLNESCSQPENCPLIDKINPETYNWEDSVSTDLTYLNGLDIFEITPEQIGIISGLAKNDNNVVYCEGKWQKVDSSAGCAYFQKDVNDSSPTFGETIQIPNGKIVYADCVSPAFLPILPLKEFSLSQTSSNLIYWIIGIAVVLIIVLFLVFRKKK